MPPGDPSPSLEPLLRARAGNSYAQPSLRLRSFPPPAQISPKRDQKDDFIDFIRALGRLAVSPITVPVNIIRRTLTSPLTISLVLKLILLGLLVLGSAIFSILAVGAFWYSWGTGGVVEVEGWLTYGSRTHRTPHVLIPLTPSKFQEDLRYDVEVEMELVRPNRASEEFGNFMLSLELRSQRNSEIAVLSAAQPSLPPPALLTSYLPVNPIPCLLPWPMRFLCPSRLLGTGSDIHRPNPKRRDRNRSKTYFGSPVRAGDVVLLTKELMEGVVLVPGLGGEAVVGSAFVSIGREDSFPDASDAKCTSVVREVCTTGWVILRFSPRPTGIRWLLSSHPIPPLLLLPPISLTLTLTSSIMAFFIITYIVRPKKSGSVRPAKPQSTIGGKGKRKAASSMSVDEQLLEERRSRVFSERDQEERREEDRRQREWEEVESMAAGGLRRIPEAKKRSRIGESTIGGSETTGIAPSLVPSFSPIPEASDDSVSETTVTETAATGSVADGEGEGEGSSRRSSDGSDDWEVAR